MDGLERLTTLGERTLAELERPTTLSERTLVELERPTALGERTLAEPERPTSLVEQTTTNVERCLYTVLININLKDEPLVHRLFYVVIASMIYI